MSASEDNQDTLTWEKRDEAKCKRHAIEAIADLVSSSSFISKCVDTRKYDYDSGKYKTIKAAHDFDLMKGVLAYAQKWDVPFDPLFLQQTISMQNKKRWKGEGYTQEVDAWGEHEEIHHIWKSSMETDFC